MTNNIIPKEKLALYHQLIKVHSNVEPKGKTMPYTSINGHMFSFLTTEGVMGLRLSKQDREAYLQKYNTPPMEQHGKIMKEYVIIPDELMNNTSQLSMYFQQSINHVAGLKPKGPKK